MWAVALLGSVVALFSCAPPELWNFQPLCLVFDETLPTRPASRAYLHLVSATYCIPCFHAAHLYAAVHSSFIVYMAKPVSSRK